MLKTLAPFLILSGMLGSAAGAAPETIVLWPEGAPGETGAAVQEKDVTKPGDDLIAGKRVIRLTNVTNPTLTLYRAPKDKDTGAAVVVFPGGGYRILALDLEGTEICEWLNSLGVTAVLLKYRVRPEAQNRTAPFQDAQRALGLVRSRSAEWRIDPNRIGVIGFSAGGHLAAALSNNFEKRAYEVQDAADQVSCRPDFAMLIYPAYLTPEDHRDRMAPDLALTARTPPTLLVQTEDDVVHVESSLVYYQALKNAKVPAEMHLYSAGNHGYGLRPSKAAVSAWPLRAAEWLAATGLLHPKN
jgi:acetyl esterase/lipase